MTRLSPIPALAAAALLAACSPHSAAKAPAPAVAAKPVIDPAIPAGEYRLDKTHASLIFRVNHIGMSRFAKRFTDFDATLTLDPKSPAASRISAQVKAASIETDSYEKNFDFNGMLTGPDWLDVKRFPTITFRSTKVAMTGADTADVTGELTLHGITKPIVLKAKFNGGYAGHPMDPNARVGFSATGVFKRSDFGMGYGVPQPGSTMGVGDEVEVLIEGEFLKPNPPVAKAAAGQ